MNSSLAAQMLDHAARIMPARRRLWLQAMRAELDHIEEPLAATAFALGCVRASYAQRIEDMMTLAFLARWTFSALALAWAGFFLLGTVLFTQVKTSPGLTPADLGSDPGTDANLRFIQAYPAWEIGLIALIGVLLAGGAILLARRSPRALPALGVGVGAATLLGFLDLRLVEAGGDWILAWSAVDVIPLLCLVPVWWLCCRAPDLKTA